MGVPVVSLAEAAGGAAFRPAGAGAHGTKVCGVGTL